MKNKVSHLVNLIKMGVDFSGHSDDLDLSQEALNAGHVVRDVLAAETLDGGDGEIAREMSDEDINDTLRLYGEAGSNTRDIVGVVRQRKL